MKGEFNLNVQPNSKAMKKGLTVALTMILWFSALGLLSTVIH